MRELDHESIGGLAEEVENQLLERLYSRMDSGDARFFEAARRDGILYERMELFHQAFVTNWEGTRLTGLMVIE